ncbi:GntR family transcriptional regulator [Burkholderia multivorans]|jgi:DNA-binding GntR family transcriptional regulator|uniref:GntR family transcriptional regulator n=1 Tax=Burkholderia multivorans TaxID=87883 RepID=UPI000277CA61|nr:GntR family transcriptional regulator [Burkholderia multivorans]AJY20267.1 bacterial regulatory s, gntR family protein [Burkholderia multivorans ATCC BAA-247]AVR21531.1 GntR family transcriptional regulator [Burkholderia multivorans]EJO55160.1 FCD domain protein [Burkholderia multivorans ATCC BAA-247]MBU9496814.1 GntR family transcriptional regulator [Burkholderia multivorans]MCO1434869.1 GntR family transcriptional regulator [Burkholderia multivorans]
MNAPTDRPRDRIDASATSLAERAYALIRRDIVTMRLKPGAALNEADLVARTGIGRTPVHQAVHRLVLEGLLSVMPRKGLMVQPLSLDEIVAVIDVRRINEAHCAELAARHATPDDLAALAALLDAGRACVEQHDVEGMMELDRAFHQTIAAAARNAVLADILRGLHDRSLRFWFVTLSEPHHLADVQREHCALFERLSARDAAGARAAVERHIDSFRSTLVQHLRP